MARKYPKGSTAGIWQVKGMLQDQILLFQGQQVQLDEDGNWQADRWQWIITGQSPDSQAWVCHHGLSTQSFERRRDALDALQAAWQLYCAD